MIKIPMQYFSTLKRGNEIPTIDVALVVIRPRGEENAIALDTSSKIEVTTQVETEDGVKLVVKGKLIAQKGSVSTITGTALTMTDNVFNAETVLIMQGGRITYKTPDDPSSGVSKYEPPVAGSTDKGKIFDTDIYSAIYDASGVIKGYEKITYPNCQGVPVAFSSEDGVFRVISYTINSAPDKGQAPYVIEFVDELPSIT